MIDEKTLDKHSVTIRARKQIEVSGVEEVESFDEEMIMLKISEGRLLIEGIGLRIGELSVGNHIVNAEGEIISIQYLAKSDKSKGGIFRRK